MTDQVPGVLPDGPWFRVTQIDFDTDEEVSFVHAVCDPATLAVVRELVAVAPADVTSGPRPEDPAGVRFPVDTAMELYRITGKVPCGEPRYAYTGPVNESLNWVYCSLVDGEGW